MQAQIEQEVRTLAETLKKNGIAATELDATRMAEQMLSGTQKVQQQINNFNQNQPLNQSGNSAELDELRLQIKQKDMQIAQLQERIAQLESAQAPSEEIIQESVQDKILQEPEATPPQPMMETQTDVLDSQTPLNELLSEQEPEIVEDQSSDFSPQQSGYEEEYVSPQVVSQVQEEVDEIPQEITSNQWDNQEVVQEPIQEIQSTSPEITSEIQEDIQEIGIQSPREQEEYQQEQEEIGFIGEDIPEKTQEQPGSAPENKGNGLTQAEKEMTDITKLFNSAR